MKIERSNISGVVIVHLDDGRVIDCIQSADEPGFVVGGRPEPVIPKCHLCKEPVTEHDEDCPEFGLPRPHREASFLSWFAEMWITAHVRSAPPAFCYSCMYYGPQDRRSTYGSLVLFAPDGYPVSGAACEACAEKITKEYAEKIGEEWYTMPVHQAMGLRHAAMLEAQQRAKRI